MNKSQAQKTLFVLMAISLIGTAGIALPYPVLAPYFLDFPANDLTRFLNIEPKILLGIALSVYPLGMLIGGSFVGAMSDLYGQKKLLMLTLLGTALSYLISAFAVGSHSYILLIASRFAAGLCEGNVAIARAMAADLHPHINKTKALSWLFATVYAGWLLGPLAGGYLLPYGITWVFAVGAIASLATYLIVWVTIDGKTKKQTGNTSLLKLIVQENSFALLKHRILWPLFSFYIVYTLGINLFYEFYPVWLVEKHDFTSQQIAWMTVVITSCMIVTSLAFASMIINKMGRYRSLVGSVLLLSLLMILITTTGQSVLFVFFATMGASIAISNAVTPAYMSDRFEHFGQGKIMGLQTSLFFLANVVMAIGGSFIAIFSVDAILLCAGAAIAISLVILFLGGEYKTLKSQAPSQ